MESIAPVAVVPAVPAAPEKPLGKPTKHSSSHLTKTKMCRFFPAGVCRQGPACNFAHSAEELRKPVNLSKTSLCREFLVGKCPHRAKDCAYAHGRRELRALLGRGRARKAVLAASAEEAAVAKLFSQGSEDDGSTQAEEAGDLRELLRQQLQGHEFAGKQQSSKEEWLARTPSSCSLQDLAVTRQPSSESDIDLLPLPDKDDWVRRCSESSWGSFRSGATTPLTLPDLRKSSLESTPCWDAASTSAATNSPRSNDTPFSPPISPISTRSPWSSDRAPTSTEDSVRMNASQLKSTLSRAGSSSSSQGQTVYPCVGNLMVPSFVWQGKVFIGDVVEVLKQAEPEYYQD